MPTKFDDSEKEEWGGWKIVSEMLDNPDKYGIYPTSKCYRELYEFVVTQKKKAYEEGRRVGKEEEQYKVLGNLRKLFAKGDGDDASNPTK